MQNNEATVEQRYWCLASHDLTEAFLSKPSDAIRYPLTGGEGEPKLADIQLVFSATVARVEFPIGADAMRSNEALTNTKHNHPFLG